MFSHAFKKEHRDWGLKDAFYSVYPWSRSATSQSFWDETKYITIPFHAYWCNKHNFIKRMGGRRGARSKMCNKLIGSRMILIKGVKLIRRYATGYMIRRQRQGHKVILSVTSQNNVPIVGNHKYVTINHVVNIFHQVIVRMRTFFSWVSRKHTHISKGGSIYTTLNMLQIERIPLNKFNLSSHLLLHFGAVPRG